MISERMIKMASGGSAIRAMFEEGKRLAEQFGRENVFVTDLRAEGATQISG